MVSGSETSAPSISGAFRNAEATVQAIETLMVVYSSDATKAMLVCAQQERDAIRQRRHQAKPTWARMQSIAMRAKTARKKRDQLVDKLTAIDVEMEALMVKRAATKSALDGNEVAIASMSQDLEGVLSKASLEQGVLGTLQAAEGLLNHLAAFLGQEDIWLLVGGLQSLRTRN